MSLEQTLEEMQKLYLDTERQFQEFIYIIPIDNNSEVYSPRLYNILQFACAQVDSLFKIICKQLGITVARQNFPEFHNILNEKGMLEAQEVFLFDKKQMLHPFNKSLEHPWWAAYNDTKHQLPEGVRQGTLGNVLDAMAASYLLNNIANLTRWYAKDVGNLLDANNWGHSNWKDFGPNTLMIMRGLRTQSPIDDSKFFRLNSEYHAGGAGF